MKVLIVNKFLYPNGGSETYIFKIGEQLQSLGHEVQYFGMEHEGRIVGNRIDVYTENMDFHTGKLKKLLYPFTIIYSKEAYRKMTLVLDDFKPDVVHLNNFNFQLTPSIIYAIRDWEKNHHRVKIVYTAHDYQWVCPNHMMQLPSTKEVCFKCEGCNFWECTRNRCIHGSLIKSLLGTIEAQYYRKRITYNMVDSIICPSEFLKEKLDTYSGLNKKTIAIHNFVENNREFNIKEDYILYFGRFAEEKGVKTLLEVCRELPEVRFVFAGNGPLVDEVDRLDNIDNKGFIEGMVLADVISKARLVVFPSEWYENCPFTVMEAISYGTPVVGSNIGGVPELIKDGENGILFEAGNKEELKRVIKELWSDYERLETLTTGARNTIYLSLPDYVEELLRIYRD